jgi:hypothetical protein
MVSLGALAFVFLLPLCNSILPHMFKIGHPYLGKPKLQAFSRDLRIPAVTLNPRSTFDEIITVVVSTKFRSQFLNKIVNFRIPKNYTIMQIKEIVRARFPGHPPECLQELFFGLEKLENNRRIIDIANLTTLPLNLDMISGTSVYKRPLNIRLAIDAYVSLLVQQNFLSNTLLSILSNSSTNMNTSISAPASLIYSKLYNTINTSIWEDYGDEIQAALLLESNPVISTPDVLTRTLHMSDYKSIDDYRERALTPLTRTVVRMWGLNRRKGTTLLLYSTLCLVGLH